MLVIEAIFVGLWTVMIYFLLYPLGNWFLLGFCKHGFAGILGIHDYYCRLKGGTRSNHKTLFLESIGEGLLFVVAHLFIPDHWVSVFLFGCTLHLLLEVIGVHATFVKTHCTKNK